MSKIKKNIKDEEKLFFEFSFKRLLDTWNYV